jgi:hypothetical protein
MVGVVVGDDHAPDRLAGQRAGAQRLPVLQAHLVAVAGVHDGPAVAVVQDVDVDVVEAVGQADARPEHALGDLQRLPRLGRVRPGEAEARAGGRAHEASSSALSR